MESRIKEKIRQKSKELGFDIIKFTGVELDNKYLTAFNDWLDKKYEGAMAYMREKEKRKNLKKILPKAKTVISFATNYFHEQEDLEDDEARVARYAYGRDYHKIIGKRLKKLEKYISELSPEAETKSYVDTGPVLERAFAEQSGIGVIGKNCCLITEEFGSWVFLSVLITTLDIPKDEADESTKKDFSVCGSCRICIDACPTGAIVAPGVIDSKKCISYLTIENKDEEIPEEFREIIKKTKRLYGCDICQEVCPHNIRAKEQKDSEFTQKKIGGNKLNTKKILEIKDDKEFLYNFAGSPIMRAKRKGLQRNAKIFQKN